MLTKRATRSTGRVGSALNQSCTYVDSPTSYSYSFVIRDPCCVTVTVTVTVTGATSKPSRVGSTEPRKEVQGEEVKSRIGTQWVPNPTRQSWRPPEPSLALVRGDPDLRSVDRECASRVTEPRNAQSDGWPIRPHGQQQPAHVQPVSWTRRGLRAGRACIGVP